MLSVPGRVLPVVISLLAALLSATVGCDTRGRGGSGDDDSTGDDDDDTTPVGDDDTTPVGDDDTSGDDDSTPVGDDDSTTPDFAPAGLSFELSLTANPGLGGNVGILANFTVRYWEDLANGVLLCNQRMDVKGSATFGYGVMGTDCGSCTGHISFEQSTAQDVSNPAIDPDDCDSAVLAAANKDYGTYLLTSISNSGLGDFLDLALLDADSVDQLGIEYTDNSDFTTADLISQIEGQGATFTHFAAVEAVTNSLSQLSALGTVAEPIGSTLWYPYFWFGVDPSQNPNTGMEMDGDYFGQAMWTVTFSE